MGANAHTAGFDGSDVSPAKPAEMTHTADASAAANATQPGDVSASAEAAAHTAPVATTTAATARLCLRSKQARRQKGRRQNRYHLFHRFLHSVMDGARHLTHQASDEPKIGLVLDLPTKFTFRNQAPGTEQNWLTFPCSTERHLQKSGRGPRSMHGSCGLFPKRTISFSVMHASVMTARVRSLKSQFNSSGPRPTYLAGRMPPANAAGIADRRPQASSRRQISHDGVYDDPSSIR
jgi:hypothetical protein